jgi:hypothetical protein
MKPGNNKSNKVTAGKKPVKPVNNITAGKKTVKPGSATKMLNVLLSVVTVIFIILMTAGINPFLLKKFQELDIFMFNIDFLKDNLSTAGGLVIWLGSFLNQFFYNPLSGSIIYVLLLAFVTFLTYRLFDLKKSSFPLALIPSLLLLLTLTETGYMVYLFKINSIAFVNIISVICLIFGLYLIKNANNLFLKILVVTSYLILAFPVSGFYALFSGLLMIIVSIKEYFRKKDIKQLLPAVILFVLIPLVPYLYQRYIYDDAFISDIYFTLLPGFKLNKDFIVLWLPYFLHGVYFIFMLFYNSSDKNKTSNDSISDSKDHKNKRSLIFNPAPTIIVLFTFLFVIMFSYRDQNFNTELKMQAAIDNEDWNEVLNLTRKQVDEPTRNIVMYTNLALYKLGTAGDRMFQYPFGQKKINCPVPVSSIQISGFQMYYHYGLTNYSYKWCMESLVENGIKTNQLKYFVLSSLVNGETKLAAKYNDMLKSTLFYKKWANDHQKYINNPQEIAVSPEFSGIKKLTAKYDILDGDHQMLEPYLRNYFSNLKDGPAEQLELSLLYCLELKDMNKFWPRFLYWAMTQKRIPVHFQEAALLFQNIQNNNINLQNVAFDEKVINSFRNFLSLSKQYSNLPIEEAKELYKNQIGGTYWYYFLFYNESSEKSDNNE